jgi:hypothetical protein
MRFIPVLQAGLRLGGGLEMSSIQFPALSIFRVVKTRSNQPISISGTDFSSRSV